MSKQKARKDIEARIAMHRLGLLGLDLLPDEDQFDFPVRVSISAIDTKAMLHVRIPYSLEALRQYRQAMGMGWKMNGGWCDTQHDNCVTRHGDYIRPELSPDGKDWLNPFAVSLTMRTDIDGSICHIEQVGVKEMPVWEVVCQ